MALSEGLTGCVATSKGPLIRGQTRASVSTRPYTYMILRAASTCGPHFAYRSSQRPSENPSTCQPLEPKIPLPPSGQGFLATGTSWYQTTKNPVNPEHPVNLVLLMVGTRSCWHWVRWVKQAPGKMGLILL